MGKIYPPKPPVCVDLCRAECKLPAKTPRQVYQKSGRSLALMVIGAPANMLEPLLTGEHARWVRLILNVLPRPQLHNTTTPQPGPQLHNSTTPRCPPRGQRESRDCPTAALQMGSPSQQSFHASALGEEVHGHPNLYAKITPPLRQNIAPRSRSSAKTPRHGPTHRYRLG